MAEASLDWLHGDKLHRVWKLVGDAMERRALEARGTVELRDLSRDERHALSDVIGTAVTGEVLRLQLAELDGRLRTRTGHALVDVVTLLTGTELVDRAARRRAAVARRDEPFEVASEWLRANVAGEATGTPEVAGWVDEWLAGLRRDGVLTGVPQSSTLLVTALQVLQDRGVFEGRSGVAPEAAKTRRGPGQEGGRRQEVVSRTDLAARRTGSAHGLDEGTKLTLLVLRAAAVRAGEDLPRTAADRRRLWDTLGVIADRVSVTCLTWNVRRGGPSAQPHEASDTAAGPAPNHVTWWDLESGLEWAAGQTVLVCENPRTLEAIASCGTSRRVGVVCTMGRSNLVVREVLARLVSSGAVLRYHGDFDWPGVSLANACLDEFGAQPWLMSADDYHSGYGTHPLRGTPIEASWDPELGAAMRTRGVAVHEEAVLARLLERLTELAPG